MELFRLQSSLSHEDEVRADQDQWACEERILGFDSVSASKKLELFRVNCGITQDTMCRYMGVSKRSYCDYESGETRIPFKALLKLAETTDFDFNELIVGDKDRVGAAYRRKVVDMAKRIVSYCLENAEELSVTQMFFVAESYVAEFGVREDLWFAWIDDRIQSVIRDPKTDEEINSHHSPRI